MNDVTKWIFLLAVLAISYGTSYVVTRRFPNAWERSARWTAKHPWLNGLIFAVGAVVIGLAFIWVAGKPFSESWPGLVVGAVLVFVLFAFMTKMWIKRQST